MTMLPSGPVNRSQWCKQTYCTGGDVIMRNTITIPAITANAACAADLGGTTLVSNCFNKLSNFVGEPRQGYAAIDGFCEWLVLSMLLISAACSVQNHPKLLVEVALIYLCDAFPVARIGFPVCTSCSVGNIVESKRVW